MQAVREKEGIARMGERNLDQELVERVQAGEKAAFDILVRKYEHKLANVISRYIHDPSEVLDVSQEAFIKAYRALPNFRGDSAFYTWLYRIAINTAKNYLVAAGRRPPNNSRRVQVSRNTPRPSARRSRASWRQRSRRRSRNCPRSCAWPSCCANWRV
jgi:RNA polymerase sigma factor (sigma-70 family)